jgi:hypothetical protein
MPERILCLLQFPDNSPRFSDFESDGSLSIDESNLHRGYPAGLIFREEGFVPGITFTHRREVRPVRRREIQTTSGGFPTPTMAITWKCPLPPPSPIPSSFGAIMSFRWRIPKENNLTGSCSPWEQARREAQLAGLRFRKGDRLQVHDGPHVGKSGVVEQILFGHHHAYLIQPAEGEAFQASDAQVEPAPQNSSS